MSVRFSAAAVAVLILAACGGGEEPAELTAETSAPPSSPAPSPPGTPTVTAPPEPEADVAEVGDPATIAIPAIGVDAELVGIGLNDDGSMETPEYGQNLAGWYTEGPKPGESGPAVIAGHVDNSEGPDTFARLHELAPGDEIIVTDDEGNEYTWTVERSQISNKRELPDEEIWNDTDKPVLRLITCTGAYVDGAYVDNLIIYAS